MKNDSYSSIDQNLKLFIHNFLVENNLHNSANSLERESYENINYGQELPIKSNQTFLFEWWKIFFESYMTDIKAKFCETEKFNFQSRIFDQLDSSCFFQKSILANNSNSQDSNFFSLFKNFNSYGNEYLNHDTHQNYNPLTLYNPMFLGNGMAFNHIANASRQAIKGGIEKPTTTSLLSQQLINDSIDKKPVVTNHNNLNVSITNVTNMYSNPTCSHSKSYNEASNKNAKASIKIKKKIFAKVTPMDRVRTVITTPTTEKISSNSEGVSTGKNFTAEKVRSIKNNKIVFVHSKNQVKPPIKKEPVNEFSNNINLFQMVSGEKELSKDEIGYEILHQNSLKTNKISELNDQDKDTDSVENTNNDKKPRGSRYRGVSRNGNQWQVLIMVQKKKRYVGSYSNEQEAARAYDKAALQNHGAKAKTNFDYKEEELKKIMNEAPILKLSNHVDNRDRD